jgi:hypothetical protein
MTYPPIEFLYNEHYKGDNGEVGPFFDVATVEVDAEVDSLVLKIAAPGWITFTRAGWEELVQAVKVRFEEEAQNGEENSK